MSWIVNAKNIPLNANPGTLPDMSGTLQDWFVKMVFGLVTKTVSNFQVIESVVETSFHGVWQPLSGRQIMMKPEGQRAWNWFMLHSDVTLRLRVDDIVNYLGTQYRVMNSKDYSLYKYRYYELISDFIESGPPTP